MIKLDTTMVVKRLILDKINREGPINSYELKKSVIRQVESLLGWHSGHHKIKYSIWLGDLFAEGRVHFTDDMEIDLIGDVDP